MTRSPDEEWDALFFSTGVEVIVLASCCEIVVWGTEGARENHDSIHFLYWMQYLTEDL
jgi:hypothetical protein